VAVLCLGQVEEFYPAPMLQIEEWAEPAPLHDYVMENRWIPGKTELDGDRS
jgi:5,6-dimethylbenzimidazole synthase